MTTLIVQVSLLLLAGLLAPAAMPRLSAAHRHLVLLATIATALVLPLASMAVPEWQPAILPAAARIDVEVPRVETPAMSLPSHAARAERPLTEPAEMGGTRSALPIALMLAWIIGALAVGAWLILGRVRLAAITRRAWPAHGEEWTTLLREERALAGVGRPVRLFVSPAASTPLTWGSRRPVILLPEDALEWPSAHRRVVLRHELAHVARHDALAQLAGGVLCAIHWYHPLAWLAARRLRMECERACDDRVLLTGTLPHEYAAHLLDVARSVRSLGGPGFVSLAMARPSQLERRLLALLDPTRPRSALSAPARAMALAASAALLLGLSAFRPVPRAIPPLPERALPSVVATSPTDSLIEKSVAAQPGGTLVINLQRTGARLAITAWDEPRVEVRGSLGGNDWKDTEVELVATANGAELRTTTPNVGRQTSFSHRFDIHVPRHFDLRVQSAGGSIAIDGVVGRFTGTTGGGEITIRHAKGSATLSTGGGDVRVTDSELDGDISTGGGVVRIENAKGSLRGQSGTGDVRYAEPREPETGEGRRIPITSSTTTYVMHDDPKAAAHFGERGIRQRRSGGGISLPAAPDGARVTTGGGDVRIGPSAGEVYASTGGGRVEIGPASGSVIASTGSGDLAITFQGGGAHSADLATGNGRATLVLPSDVSATLILESAYTNNFHRVTRIDSDFPLETTETKAWDSSVGTPRRYVRARVVLGSGAGTIRVRVVNGDIVVRRAARGS